MKVRDILNMSIDDFNRLTEKQLRNVTKTLADAANKRIKRLADSGNTESPAYKGVQNSGGKISTAGKNTRQQLQKEFIRAKTFLNAKTSTLSGVKKVENEFIDRVSGDGEKIGLSPEQNKQFWKSYHRFQELHPEQVMKRGGSTQIQQQIYDLVVSGKNSRSIAQSLRRSLEKEYEEEEEYESEYSGFGEFLE